MLVNAKCAPTTSGPCWRMPRAPGQAGAGAGKTDPIPTAKTESAKRVPDQDLLRRRRRVPCRDALHGDTAERGRHALPLPPRLRGDAPQLEFADLWTRRGYSPTFAAAPRSADDAGSRDERPLRRLPARAYGMTGDPMAGIRPALTPPAPSPALPFSSSGAGASASPAAAGFRRSSTERNRRPDCLGRCSRRARKKIPAFVRGMVVKAVEDSCARTDRSRHRRSWRKSARGCRRRNFSVTGGERFATAVRRSRLKRRCYPLARNRGSTFGARLIRCMLALAIQGLISSSVSAGRRLVPAPLVARFGGLWWHTYQPGTRVFSR